MPQKCISLCNEHFTWPGLHFSTAVTEAASALVHELCPGSQVPVSPTLYEFVVSPCWVFDLVSLTSVGMWVLPPQARPQVVTAEHWKAWRVAIG